MASATRRIPFWASASVVCSLTFVVLPSICFAQDDFDLNSSSPTASSTPANNSSSTSSAAVQTHTISVGLADHKFRPESTNANIGDVSHLLQATRKKLSYLSFLPATQQIHWSPTDILKTIEFAFYPLNHSVVRAEYGFPCIPYEMIGQGKTGFFSGFKPVDSVLTSPPTYSIEIENTDPIFFYCSAVGSCINYGMVGVINPNTTTSVARQHQLALDSSYMLNPGEPFPPESPESSNAPISSGTAGLSDGTSSEKEGLSTGAIAGITIACSSVVIIAALLFFFWGRTKGLRVKVDQNTGAVRQGPNNRSLPAILETGHTHPAILRGNEVGGIYHQYQRTPLLSPPIVDSAYQQYSYNQYNNAPSYSTPVPSYFHPPPPSTHAPSPLPHPPPPSSSQQDLQQQQNAYKYDINNPAGHPGHTIPPIQRQPPPSFHHASSQRSLGGAFELSPTGDYPATLQNNHVNPSHIGNNANADSPDIISPSPSHAHRIASTPHVLAAADTAATNEVEEAIPNYYETVYRHSPKHINGGRIGPTEIDGRAVTGEIAPARMIEAKWEEVGEKTVG